MNARRTRTLRAALVLAAATVSLLAGAASLPGDASSRDSGVAAHKAGRLVPSYAFEYHHSVWDYYFVTSDDNEIAILDDGAFGGVWTRTGQLFEVWSEPGDGLTPTCRFFGVGFAPRSSHFLTPFPAECAAIMTDPNWEFETIAFYLQLPDGNGECTDDPVPLFRLYNNFAGGAPNHRYTTSETTVREMQAAGWTVEGNAVTGTFACVPQRRAVPFQEMAGFLGNPTLTTLSRP